MLMIHLPLNGDLHNQGLANTEVTNNGATVDNNGKIGKCYSFDGTSKYISLTNPFTDASEISCSIWIKPLANTSTNEQIMNIGTSSGWNNIRFGILQRSNNQLLFHVSDGTNNIAYSCYSSAINLNEWIHIVCTYKNRELKMYLNGELAKTYSISFDPSFSGISKIGIGAAPNGAEKFTGFINDVKIFSHCLSQKEISELKKMLILHYPLDNNGVGNKNISSKYVSCASWNPDNTNNGGRTKYYGDYGIIIPAVEKADTFFTIWTTESLENGQIYTLSANVSGLIEGTYYRFSLFAQNNSSMGTICFDHNGRNSLTFTMNYTGTVNTATVDGKTYYKLFMDDITRDIASGQGEITINNIKLEKGTIATPWCPNPSDALYTVLGYNDGIEYDTSGYGNNGTIVGTLNYSTDSPRYLASAYFDGNTACIRTPYNAVAWKTNFTINLWFKKNELNGNKGYETLFGGPSGFEMDTRAGNSTTLSLYMASTRGGNAYSPFNLGEWYMVTMVNDGTNELYYVNGELSKTIEKKNMPSGNYFIGAWSSETQQNYKGLISDFRIYATALSAEEIQKLYTVSASIDSNGNAYSAAYVEG